ncbi:unnamed protein product [Rhizoctonia solani]|nr:unnamed protein product [Rhizoctonia solani]
MLSRIRPSARHDQPGIKVTQYTSPNRQMSLPPTTELEPTPDVTVPWLLSPKWSPSEPVWSKRRPVKPAKETLAEMTSTYLFLQSEFIYPSLRFEDGEPVINESYVEMQHYVMKLQGLLDELEALKVSEAEATGKTKLMVEIRRAIERVEAWVEQERVKAQKFEEKLQSLLASQQEPRGRQSGESECLIA